MRWSSVVSLALLGALVLCTLRRCEGHGWVSSPPSRQGQCATGMVTNCGEIQYEPQSVEALKGKTTCNGDQPQWAVLADESKPWVHTPVGNGINKFTWTQTAIHVAADWEYWIGGRKIAQFLGTANTIHCVDLTGYTGYQKILAIWNIGDTADAFYSCVDVNIGAGTGAGSSCVGGGANVFTPPAITGCTSTTSSTSYIVASGDTLQSIATARGLTLAQLLAVNPLLTSTTVPEVGSAVVIPPTAAIVCSKPMSSTGSSHAVATSTGPASTSSTCHTLTSSTYSVAAGDSLTSIAASRGLDVSTVLAANPNLLSVGQSLVIPAGASYTCQQTCSTVTNYITHVVVAGDTLNAIAAALGSSLAAILQANPTLLTPDLITVGQQVVVPVITQLCTVPSTTPTPGTTGRAGGGGGTGHHNNAHEHHTQSVVVTIDTDSSTSAASDTHPMMPLMLVSALGIFALLNV